MATARKATAAKGTSKSKALVIAKPLPSRTAKPLTVYGPGAEQGAFVEWWPLTSIKPYARNPRKNAGAIAGVKGSLERFGWRQPIVVDEAGIVIVGDTRLKAALLLGWTQAPVHVARGLTKAEVKAYRLADNKLHEHAQWDFDLLAMELSDLELDKFDMPLLGWTPTAIDHILGRGDDFAPVGADEQGKLDEKKPITCPHCGETFTL